MIKTWADIPGWFNFQDVYDSAVDDAVDGDVLVEVGSFLGKSAAYMAERIKKSKKRLTFYAVDIWDDDIWWTGLRPDDLPYPWPVGELCGRPLDRAFLYCMNSVGAHGGVVRPMQMDSVEAAGTFHDGSLSFVFIDADHRWDAVVKDLEAWKPKVRPGGVFAGHDYIAPLWPDVKRAVDLEFGKKVEVLGTSWVVRKGA